MMFSNAIKLLSLFILLKETKNVHAEGFLRHHHLPSSQAGQQQKLVKEEEDLWSRLLLSTFGSLDAATNPPTTAITFPTVSPVSQANTIVPQPTLETPDPSAPSTKLVTETPTVGETPLPTTTTPTSAPSASVTARPSISKTPGPTVAETSAPSVAPETATPTTTSPTSTPSATVTAIPTIGETPRPTIAETPAPSVAPVTASPTIGETPGPATVVPETTAPSVSPVTNAPTAEETQLPITVAPSAPFGTPSPTVGVCESLLWSDEFDSGAASNTPDEDIWSFDLGNGMDGWGNLELQQYTNSSDNIRVQDGVLIITVKDDFTPEGGRGFTSGRIRTEDKLEILYGNIEARIKIPTIGDGLWPAFWTLGGNHRETGWPASGEIDIFEMGSGDAIAAGAAHRRVTSATHREVRGDQASVTGTFDFPTDLNDGEFHVYRLEWTSSRISTFVDDNLILDFDITEGICRDCSEFHQPHFLLLNVAVGGYFTGILEPTGITAPLPVEMIVDYVRVCDNGETALSGSAIEPPTEFPFDCGSPGDCTTTALNNYANGATCGARIMSLIEEGMSEEAACRQVAGTEYPAECGQCVSQVLDCGLEACTDEALDADAAGLTCRARISFLIGLFGYTEQEACNRVGGREHPSECGVCNPIDCDKQDTCTTEVLNSSAGGPTCLERITFLIEAGSSESEACKQVAGVEFAPECGPCDIIDCGQPLTCTNEVLDTDAGGFSCQERISFLMSSMGLSEADACQQIAVDEFPGECGQCVEDSLDCGSPETCTKAVLDADADGFSCQNRIKFLIGSMGFSEQDACNQIALTEFPTQCGPCGSTGSPSIDCGTPGTCTDDVLLTDADGFLCGDRISFLITSSGLDELAACSQIATEFPAECAGCNPISSPVDCGVPEICTESVLGTDAGGFPCGDRISFLITSSGLGELAACSQVATEFPAECSGCNPISSPVDCGVPETCTDDVLVADAGGFPCGDRISFLITSSGLDELAACSQIATEFPAECSGCNPISSSIGCGVPETCTESVLVADAGGFPCGDRISFLITSSGLEELAACSQVATEFPAECSGCDPPNPS